MILIEIILVTSTAPPSKNGGAFGGVTHDAVPAADAAAFAMIGLMFFLFTCFGFWAWRLRKLSLAMKPEYCSESLPSVNDRQNDAPPWERPDDWWKN